MSNIDKQTGRFLFDLKDAEHKAAAQWMLLALMNKGICFSCSRSNNVTTIKIEFARDHHKAFNMFVEFADTLAGKNKRQS